MPGLHRTGIYAVGLLFGLSLTGPTVADEALMHELVARLTALNVVTLASLVLAPAPPANVQISGAVRPSTTLSWDRVPGAMA